MFGLFYPLNLRDNYTYQQLQLKVFIFPQSVFISYYFQLTFFISKDVILLCYL
jgi:hypothetical protein